MSMVSRSAIIAMILFSSCLYPTSFKPEIGTFNRVDDFRFGLKITQEVGPFEIYGSYTYTTGKSFHYYSFGTLLNITKKWNIELGYNDESMAIAPSFAGRFMTTLGTLFAKVDYNDYMHYKGAYTKINYRYNRKFSGHIKFYYEEHTPLQKSSDYSFFQRDTKFRENPQFMPGKYYKGEITLQFANLSNPLRPIWGYKIEPSIQIISGENVFYKTSLEMTQYIKVHQYQRLRLDFFGIFIDKGAPFEELYSFSGFRQLPGIGIREYILDRALMANAQYNFDGKILQYLGDWFGKNMEIAPAANFGIGNLSANQLSGQSGTDGLISTLSIHIKDKYDLFEFVLAQRLDKKSDMRFYFSIELFDLLFGTE